MIAHTQQLGMMVMHIMFKPFIQTSHVVHDLPLLVDGSMLGVSSLVKQTQNFTILLPQYAIDNCHYT